MKITIKNYDYKYSVELPDGTPFDEVMDEFKGLCKAIYSDVLVNEYWK